MDTASMERKKVGAFWFIWVNCPGCGEGRWAPESRVKTALFTGQCQKCYLGIARNEMGIYHTSGKENL